MQPQRDIPNVPPDEAETAGLLDVLQAHQVELELLNEDLERFFNLSQDIMGLATMYGRFIRVNPAFERLFGHSQEELFNRNFLIFIHPDDRQATRQAMAELRAGRSILDFVNRCRCRDGCYHWLEWRVTPYQGEFMYALARDITRRKEAEEALHKIQGELESEVQRRTAQLQERTTQLHAMAGTIIQAEERERTRISRLIHDHLQQMLVGALLNLRMMKGKDRYPELAADFADIECMLKDSIATAQSLTTELSPPCCINMASGAKHVHTSTPVLQSSPLHHSNLTESSSPLHRAFTIRRHGRSDGRAHSDFPHLTSSIQPTSAIMKITTYKLHRMSICTSCTSCCSPRRASPSNSCFPIASM